MQHRNKNLSWLLLTLFLVNALFWTYSPPALADALAHQDLAAVATQDSVSQAADNSYGDGKTQCNHGCHALHHVQGQVCAILSLALPPSDNEFAVGREVFRLSDFPDTQERPPRIPFRA